jgi:hypothetical protein
MRESEMDQKYTYSHEVRSRDVLHLTLELGAVEALRKTIRKHMAYKVEFSLDEIKCLNELLRTFESIVQMPGAQKAPWHLEEHLIDKEAM